MGYINICVLILHEEHFMPLWICHQKRIIHFNSSDSATSEKLKSHVEVSAHDRVALHLSFCILDILAKTFNTPEDVVQLFFERNLFNKHLDWGTVALSFFGASNF